MLTSLKRKPCSILGIDISPSSVKILEISSLHEQYCVEAYAHAQLPEYSNDVETTATYLKSLFSSENFSSRQVVLAVPDSCTISKIIQISAHAHEHDLEEWVLMEAEKFIPYSLDEINIDFNVLGPSPNDSERLDVLVVASRSENVAMRVETARRAGLVVQVVDIESHAIERATRLGKADNSEMYTAMFDIDSLYMRSFIFNGDNIIFSREEALSQMLPRSFDLLLQQIKRALQFFYSTVQYVCIGQIVLAGSVARLHDLQQFLQAQLGIPTHIANPFSGMKYATMAIRDSIERDAPMLMVACGLALRR